MDQWLDSLSEDWPSQPSLQHDPSSVQEENVSPKVNGSLSRIPRRISSNVLSTNRKELGRRVSMPGGDVAKTALRERTSSSLNISHKPKSGDQIKPYSSDLAHKENDDANDGSSPSSSSVLLGTVAFKASPAKNNHETPEWKRRIVQGKIGPNDQTDMFGPIGLQSIFKQPATAPRSKEQQGHASSEVQDDAEPKTSSLPPQSPSSKPELVTPDQMTPAGQQAFEIGQKEGEQTGEQEYAESVLIVPAKQDVIAKMQYADSTLPHRPESRQQGGSRSSANSTLRSFIGPFGDSQEDCRFDQSDSKDFAPVYISKSHTIDGKVDYAAIDIGLHKLNLNMENLRKSRETQSENLQPEDNDSQDVGIGTLDMSFRKSQINEITNQSLPEDLSVGTDAFAANGGFISLHRGGHSNEGSFHRRPLSPSSSNHIDEVSENHVRASSQALPSPQNSQRKIFKPATPPRTPTKDNEDRPRSSGSPLKLFDKYDTFTNNRLARHISRFEETLAQDEPLEKSPEAHSQPLSPSPGPKGARKANHWDQSIQSNPGRRVSSFGSGELNDHNFATDSQLPAEMAHSSCSQDDIAMSILPNSKQSRSISRGTRRPSRTDRNHPAFGEPPGEVDLPDDGRRASQPYPFSEEVSYTAHGKRLPGPSEKDTARKRQRTLGNSEEQKQATLNDLSKQSTPIVKVTSMAVASGRKRKDARYDSERQAADPQILALRQTLRPRNPTPNQAGSAGRQILLSKPEHPCITITGYGRKVIGEKAERCSQSTVDPPTQIVAGALATVALNTVQDMESGSRKASVATCDFFNEAQQIMALIRAEKRPRSSHESAETSNMGHSMIQEESAMADSTKDDLTRPPSREGERLMRVPVSAPHNARIVSHLRKFEDKDDLGLALPSSGKSLRINGYEIPSLTSRSKPSGEEQAADMASDPLNVRIRERNVDQDGNPDSPPSHRQLYATTRSGSHNLESQGSSNSSMNKSPPTRSSHGSANLRKIAPDSVAHLLSEQMADMFFDKERGMWVKRKASSHLISFNADEHPASQQSEDDLFGDIPDLSVDEMEELRRVKDAVSSRTTSKCEASNTSEHHDASPHQNEPEAQGTKQHARPSTANGKVIPPAENSSAPSKHTNFAWSGPAPGTRATSYGDDVWLEKRIELSQPALPVLQDSPNSPEVEHEISILESREPRISTGKGKNYRQPRVVTVAFSSPLILSPYPPDEALERCDEIEPDESPSKVVSQSRQSVRRPSSSGFAYNQRHASRRLSFSNSSFIARPMSRLDELEEMSLVRYSTRPLQPTMDLAISTPMPATRTLTVPQTADHQSSINFDLSPLADFTVHQIDRPLDAQHGAVMRRHRPQAGSNVLSLTAQELVKHLTDTEPYEPYWDHLTSVDLKDCSLTSLHMLDEFCGRTQELNVARNCIRELDGVPDSVRSLNVSENRLSELTAWHTLQNLQYLNVSGNNLRSLKGFQGLFHLRTLKADNNEIESLDGIQCLNGLLSLSLRGNQIGMVDFDGFNLERLVELDLYGNQFLEVAHLNALESLKTLNLGMNGLKQLHFDGLLPRLQTLDLADNQLSYLDMTLIPNLKTLILDRNAFNQVQDLSMHKHLETISCRDQDTTANLNLSQGCHELRQLYLSSTSMSRLNLEMPFLNLNTLELASVGMQKIPKEFGLNCRNLRILNLNYNAIHDTRPLLGIARLQRLYLAGNRISRLRRTAAVLDRLSTELVEVDLRNNNLTLGFYNPQSTTTITTTSSVESRVVLRDPIVSSPHTPADGEEGEDHCTKSMQAYLLPLLDKDADMAARERLDEDTKLRRRVYEMLLVGSCKALRRLDGLEVDRRVIGKRDGVWERLIELGVLRARGG